MRPRERPKKYSCKMPGGQLEERSTIVSAAADPVAADLVAAAAVQSWSSNNQDEDYDLVDKSCDVGVLPHHGPCCLDDGEQFTHCGNDSLASDDAGEHEVILHVYDLGPLTGRLNELVLRGMNLGAFHCGIEVLGDEWSFQGFIDAWDNPTLTGVLRNEPRDHPAYIYKESLSLGKSPLGQKTIDSILDRLMEEWPANTYHLVARNCVTFAEEFANALDVAEPFPTWVRGAIDAGKTPAVFAVADYGWSWFTWLCRKQCELEAAQSQDAATAAAVAVREDDNEVVVCSARDPKVIERSSSEASRPKWWGHSWQRACGFDFGRDSCLVRQWQCS